MDINASAEYPCPGHPPVRPDACARAPDGETRHCIGRPTTRDESLAALCPICPCHRSYATKVDKVINIPYPGPLCGRETASRSDAWPGGCGVFVIITRPPVTT